MPVQIQAFNLTDFSGGLNLDTDEFRVGPNEVPEALNVDINLRGGVSHRKGYTQMYDHTAALVDLHAWYGHSTSPCLVTCDATGAIHEVRDGGSTARTGTGVWTQRRVSAEFNGALFLADEANVLELNPDTLGSTTHTTPMVAADFNSNLDSPLSNKFPRAKVVASWMGSMWAANIQENPDGLGVKRYENRIRWSHLNYAKDWHPNHFVDFGDDDGGAITALVPDGDRLLVFRERKIHAVVGSPPEAIQVYLIADTIGCTHQRKTARTPAGVFFWNEERGVYSISDRSIDWVSPQLHQAMSSGRMSGLDAVLSWGGDRLYVKLEYDTVDGQASYRSWFVYDPALGKGGGWTRHAFAIPPASIGGVQIDMPASVWFAPPDDQPLFCTIVNDKVLFRSLTSHDDEHGYVGPSNQAVFRTAWLDMGQPGQFKRFRRADIVGSGLSSTQQLALEVYVDYDSRRRRRYGEVRLHAEQGGGIFGTAVAGVGLFGPPDIPTPSIDRSSPLGRARSVQLKFIDEVDPASLDWTIDSLIVKFTPYRMRG